MKAFSSENKKDTVLSNKNLLYILGTSNHITHYIKFQNNANFLMEKGEKT